VHVLDTALVRVSPEAYNEVIDHYKTVVFGLGEIGLVAAICFLALNGVRVILVDFWSQGAKRQRLLFWIVVGVWVLLLLGFVPRQLGHMFGWW
jgi:succinate dehydrogenase / fumarate reductase cytochrome b subunit